MRITIPLTTFLIMSGEIFNHSRLVGFCRAAISATNTITTKKKKNNPHPIAIVLGDIVEELINCCCNC